MSSKKRKVIPLRYDENMYTKMIYKLILLGILPFTKAAVLSMTPKLITIIIY